ncbi:MAG: PDZ domain-containing protein, partial [Bryobacteraceae bacterium]|nr:PDZ domain-containing protein [Bryobacteraceae bacterium]
MRRMNGLGMVALTVVASSMLMAQPQPPQPAAPPAPGPRVQVFAMGGGSYLGIGVRDVEADRAKDLKLKEERGVEITAIEDDSPAAKAGLQKGDVVLEYNGQRVEGVEQFIRMVRETPVGREAKLMVSRDGRTQMMSAKVAERKGFAMAREGMRAMPRI